MDHGLYQNFLFDVCFPLILPFGVHGLASTIPSVQPNAMIKEERQIEPN